VDALRAKTPMDLPRGADLRASEASSVEPGTLEREDFVERPPPARTPPVGSAARDVRLDRARGVLELLQNRQAKRTLQGRVELGDVDRVRLVRNYYPSLGLARALVEATPDAWRSVEPFVEERVSIPVEALPFALEASGSHLCVQPELEGPLGRSHIALEPEMLDAVMSGHAARLEVNDITVERMIPKVITPDVSTAMRMYAKDPEFASALVRLYARAKQLGADVSVSNWAELTDRLPNTRASVALLRRLARKLGAKEADIRFHGRRLIEIEALETDRIVGGGPLGDVRRFRADLTRERFDMAIIRADPDAVRVDDVTLLWRLTLWGALPTCDLDYFLVCHEGGGDYEIDLLKLCARVGELGIPSEISGYLAKHAKLLPHTQEAIDALRRAAHAYAIEEDRIPVRGRKLSEFPPSQGVPPPRIDKSPRLDEDPAYAQAAKGGAPLDDAWLSSSLRASIRTMLGDPGERKDRARILGALKLIDRGLEIGAITTRELSIESAHELSSFVRGELLDDPAVMDALVRVFRRSSLDPRTSFVEGGRPLAHHRPYVEAARRLDRRMLGEAAPIERRGEAPFFMEREALGGERMRDAEPGSMLTRWAAGWTRKEPSRKEAFEARNPKLFAIDDATLDLYAFKKSGDQINVPDLTDWLRHWNDPRAFLFFARLAERHAPDNRFQATDRVRYYLERTTIPAALVTAESIPWIVRMAEGAFVDPAAILVEGPDGPCPLFEHPVCRAPALEARRRAEEIVKQLARGVAIREEVRERARRLLAGDEPAFEVSDFLEPLVAAAASGTLARVELSGLTAEERMRFAHELFAPWSHVGVIACLAGVLTDLSSEDVERLLIEKGSSADLARRFGRIASRLSELEPAALQFALADVVRDPASPDFRTLGTRIDLLGGSEAGPSSESLASPIAPSPVEHVRAFIDRILLEPPGAPIRASLLEQIDRWVLGGRLVPGAVIEAMRGFERFEPDRPEAWPLHRELAAPVVEALERYRESSPASRRDAIKAVSESAVRLARYIGGAAAADFVLPRAYAIDEASVVPLGEADDRGEWAIEVALGHIRRFAEEAPRVPASLEEQASFEWMELALRRAIPDRIDRQVMVGLCEAYQAGLVSRQTIELARESLPAPLLHEIADRVRSSELRMLLRNRPVHTRFTQRRIEGGSKPPEAKERVGAAVVSRGPKAPAREGVGSSKHIRRRCPAAIASPER
jgi:hypothetical protein